jgi:glutaredoxin
MRTISQSLIRDMLNPAGYCGHYLNQVYNEGWKPAPTDAMIDGQFFEFNVMGATAYGEVPEIPKSKTNGAKLKRELDLERVIAQAKEVLDANRIEFTEVQFRAESEDRHGHIDAAGTFRGLPYLFDLKYTGMTWGGYDRELKYSDLSGNYTLQARHYQSLRPLPFMFLVFGDGWARFFEVPFDQDEIEHHKVVATEALAAFNSMEPRPTSDSRLCFTCRMREDCGVRNKQIQVETL